MRELPGGPVLRLYAFTVQVSSLVITGQGTKIPHATNSATHTHTKKSFQSQGNRLSTNMNSLTTTNLRAIIHTASRWKMGKKKPKKRCCQSPSRVRLFVTPWTAARQASLSFTISWRLRKLMSIESVMPSNHLIL